MRSKLAWLFVILILVQFGVIFWVQSNADLARTELIDSQRGGCERGKLDRVSNAKFQRAHAEYIRSVTGAKSVKEDVKKAARKALAVYVKTSTDLLTRSQISCKEAFP